MQIVDYTYSHGIEDREGYVAIPDLDRHKPSAIQFIKLANIDIILTRPTAFLYIDGVSMSPSEMGTAPIKGYKPVIKRCTANAVHEWVHSFKGKENLVHVDSLSSTCAAGIHAFSEAQRLLYTNTVDDVIIIGGERITESTIQMFKELRIPITCGDGFAYIRLQRGGNHNYISDINWLYRYEVNPFFFDKETLNKLIPNYHVDYVKLHGTGTDSNTESESGLAEIAHPIIYKDRIGHTQGVSAALETCMVMDDPDIKGRILVTANGMGGYYGAFTLEK